jgi:hypothetical protein
LNLGIGMLLRQLFGPRRRNDERHDDRRRHRRFYGRPIKVVLEDRPYKTLDWSLGGFRINNFHRELKRGERLSGVIGPFARVKSGECVVEVVRVAENGDIGAKFVEIAPKIFVAMAGYKER